MRSSITFSRESNDLSPVAMLKSRENDWGWRYLFPLSGISGKALLLLGTACLSPTWLLSAIKDTSATVRSTRQQNVLVHGNKKTCESESPLVTTAFGNRGQGRSTAVNHREHINRFFCFILNVPASFFRNGWKCTTYNSFCIFPERDNASPIHRCINGDLVAAPLHFVMYHPRINRDPIWWSHPALSAVWPSQPSVLSVHN